MILAQAVLQIFCGQGSLGLQYKSGKRRIIHFNNHIFLRKVKQVTGIISPNSMPDIMLLAKVVLQILWELEKGANSAKYW